MGIQITITDVTNLSEDEKSLLAFILGGADVPTVAAVEAKAEPAAKPAKKAAAKPAKKAEPEPEEDEDDDLLGDDEPEYTMADAVAKATEMVSGGNATDVKAALTDLGVRKVSELKPSQIAAFIAALD